MGSPMKTIQLTVLASLALGVVACGPTPATVCAKLKELDAEPIGCEIKWNIKKSEKADEYKKDAECVLAAKAKADLSKCVSGK